MPKHNDPDALYIFLARGVSLPPPHAFGRPAYPARRSRQVPPRAASPAAWLTSLTVRAGWVTPTTGMGQWGVGAKPRPQTPSTPA